MKKIFSNNFLTKTARNIIKVSLGDIVSKIFSVGSVLILIRGLSIEDYTAYIFISSVGIYLATVIGSGINMAMVRYSLNYSSRFGSKPKALYQVAFWVEVFVFILLSSVSFFFTKDISTFIFGQLASTTSFTLGLVFGLGLLFLNFCRSIYQAEEEFNGLVITSWISQFSIFILLLGSFLFRELSAEYVVFIYAAVYFIVGGVISFFQKELFDLRETFAEFRSNKELLADFLQSLGWLIGYFFVLSVMSRLDIYFLTKYVGTKEIATYGVALQYYGMGMLLLGSIHSVLLPRFSHIEMQNVEAQKSFLVKWIRMSSCFLVPIIVFDLIGKNFFIFINGARYENAFPILVVFSIGIWLSLLISPLVNIIISNGEFKFLFGLSVFAMVFNILGNSFFLPWLGGIGAALVIVLTQNIIIQVPILLKGLKLI